MPEKYLFIFDYDGVIADSFETVIEIINDISKKVGYSPINKEGLRKLLDDNFYVAFRKTGLSITKIANYIKEVRKELIQKQQEIKFVDQIPEIIREIAKIGDIYIVTSNSEEVVTSQIRRHRLDKIVKEILGVESDKSKVRKIKSILLKYNNPEAYYIGDTSGDILEGRKAGTATIAVTWGYHNIGRLARVNPDYIAETPQQLRKIILDSVNDQNRTILVDKKDRPIGTEEKLRAHREGKLHRAFSILIFNNQGKMLIQRRAKDKYHSGGLWANTCCSHPHPNETFELATHRRLQEEMGIDTSLSRIFSFIYKHNFDNGLTENEFDHVFVGVSNSEPKPSPLEAEQIKWVDFDWLLEDIRVNPDQYTPWFKIILKRKELKEYIKNNFIKERRNYA